MKDKDEIKDLFADKLGNYEAPVRADLWTNVVSHLGDAPVTSAVTSSVSLLTKIVVSVGLVAAVLVTAVFLLREDKKPKNYNSTVNVNNQNEEKTVVLSTKEKTITKENKEIKQDKEDGDDRITNDNREDVQQLIESQPNIVDLADQNYRKEVKIIKEVESNNNTQKENGDTQEYKKFTKEEFKQPVSEPEASAKDEKTAKEVDPVTVFKELNTDTKSYELGELPNVFTPNGDGNNDVLFIKSSGLIDFTFVVLDSKQKVIYETSDVNFKWNGIDKYGNKVEPGVYGYYFVAHDSNNNKVNKFVTLTVRY